MEGDWEWVVRRILYRGYQGITQILPQINFKLALILGHIWWPLRNMLIVALNAVKDSRVIFYFEIILKCSEAKISIFRNVDLQCVRTPASLHTLQIQRCQAIHKAPQKKTVNNVRNGKKTKDVTGCKVLSHPTTKQIQSFLRTLCHSTWRSARSSPARSLGRFKRVVLLQLEIGAKKHEVLWHIYIECLTLRHWRTY